MLKMSHTFLLSTRVYNRSILSTIFTKIDNMSTSSALDMNQLKSDVQSNELHKNNNNNVEKLSDGLKSKSRIIAAAFASLNGQPDNTSPEIKTPHTDNKVAKAESVEELLSITEGEGVSRRLALKIVSVLADWTSTKKVNLADFENDFRFIKLCRVLTKSSSGRSERHLSSKSEDLSTVLSITADEEAAKLIETITLSQMVKVMTTLSSKKRRSTLLLRTLAYNISASSEKLNLKLSADLLYSMASLNFIDENLLSRIDQDICTELEVEPTIKNSAVIGSILTSLGFLKYKNTVLLDLITNWIIKNHEICRNQDIFSLFITLAMLNHMPVEADGFFKTIQSSLTESEANKPLNWLDHIWSKMLLDIASSDEISHILSENFLDSIVKTGIDKNVSTKLKILNMKGAAECILKNFKENDLLKSPPFVNGGILRRKEKLEMVESIISSLKNLMEANKYLKCNIDTGYGFYIDAECVLDDKCRPKELNVDKLEGTRIAIIALDYHDMTKGRIEPTGINIFAKKLLESKGYKVLFIPFNEYNPKDKLVNRVQYLEKKLKELLNIF